MQNNHYRLALKDAVDQLTTINETILNSMIDIITQGELKAWNESVPIGESHRFELELFKNSGDINLKLLTGLVEQIENVRESIINLNALELNDQD